MEWPLGRREDLHTEFKRVDALKDPANIAREVVGFLNAEGGKIWVGFGETGGVADSVEPVSDPDAQRDRLRDALVDLIEPSPIIGREVEINFIPFPDDPKRGVLVVEVNRGERVPYALLRQTMRAFLQRTGSRIRPMTREEVAYSFAHGSKTEGPEAQRVEELKADLAKWSESFVGLKVVVRPMSTIDLTLDSKTLMPLMHDPRATGNRLLGWTFANQYSELKPTQKGYRLGQKDSIQWLELHEPGTIEFSAGLERLEWKDGPKSLWPLALLELPTSVMRLARTLYREHSIKKPSPSAPIVLGLGIFGIRGWKLRPYSPNSIGYMMPVSKIPPLEDDQIIAEPVVERWEDLEAAPDRSAYKLIRQVYKAFEYEERMVPAEYNRDTGQLSFPS